MATKRTPAAMIVEAIRLLTQAGEELGEPIVLWRNASTMREYSATINIGLSEEGTLLVGGTDNDIDGAGMVDIDEPETITPLKLTDAQIRSLGIKK
jgi:hypothetical protein